MYHGKLDFAYFHVILQTNKSVMYFDCVNKTSVCLPVVYFCEAVLRFVFYKHWITIQLFEHAS